MRVETAGGEVIDLGTTETTPTIGIVDYSRRTTDDFGVTTVVERGFARRMSVRLALPFDGVDALQRRLAGLRATTALWVADDRFDWLSVNGFYKDFALDLAVPPVSYCTLEIEGLAASEPFTDPGGDPAPGGQVSTLQLLQPTVVTGGALASSSVAENDYPAWASGTTYALGARVIKTATHRVYESAAAGNVGNDPAGTSGKWLDVGPTNRWAMFDQALGTTTSATGTIAVSLTAGTVDAVALLDVIAATVRVQAPGYDHTVAAGAGAVTFLDLPATSGQVTVTIAGTGTVSVGTLLIGRRVALGITEASPTAGITDFSRKDVDDFGEVTVVQRAWAKKMTARALIRTDAIDLVAGRIAAVRARPSLWIGGAGIDSLTVYGFFKDFSIEAGENVSKLSLSIEGLSTAAKVEPLTVSAAWPDITDPDGTKPEPNADVTANHKSNDSDKLGGTPAATVLASIAAVTAITGPGGSIAMKISAIDASLDEARDDLAQASTDLALAQAGLATALSSITTVLTQVKLRPNLQVNGGFAQGLTGLDGLPPSATVVVNNGLWSNYFHHHATGSLAILMPPLNFAPGATYTASFDAALFATSGRSRVDVSYWTGPNGTGTGYYPDVGSERRDAPLNFDDIRDWFPFTTPETGYQSLRLRLVSEDVVNPTEIDWRRVKLELGEGPPSLYSDEATANTVDAFVKQVDTARASDTAAAASRFVIVEARVATTEGVANGAAANYTTLATTLATTTAAQATVNTNLTSRVIATEIVANGAAANYTTLASTLATSTAAQTAVNTRLSAQVGIRDNLAINGGFERGFEGVSGTAGFAIDNVLWGVSAKGSVTGSGSMAWPSFAVQPGEWYTVAADTLLVAPAGAVYVDILFFSAGGTILYDGPEHVRYASHDFSADSSGRDAIAVEAQAPTGAVYGIARFIWSGVTGPSTVGIRELKVERGRLPWTAYSVGKGTHAQTYADITTTATTLAGTNASLASLGTTLTASIATAQGTANGAATNAALAISQASNLATVVASADATAAAQISTLTSSYNGLAATSTIHSATLATMQGQLESFVTLEAIAGTSTAKLSIVSTAGPSGGFSKILLSADQIILDGQVLINDTVSGGALIYGATGRRSWYSFQDFNDNNQTTWGAGPVGTGLVSENGDPIWGMFSVASYDLNNTNSTVYVRVVRKVSGTADWPIWGGTDGVPMKFPGPGDTRLVTFHFIDAVNAGVRAQYDLQYRAGGGGANIRSTFRTLMLEEQVKTRFNEFWLRAAADAGPGGGDAGGGNINGDFTGSGGVSEDHGTTGTGSNVGKGGIRGRTVDLS